MVISTYTNRPMILDHNNLVIWRGFHFNKYFLKLSFKLPKKMADQKIWKKLKVGMSNKTDARAL